MDKLHVYYSGESVRKKTPKPSTSGICNDWRKNSHKNLTILLVFLAVMIDCMLMTVVGE